MVSNYSTLNGGTGIDTLIGGDGNDIYVVDSVTDTIIDSAGTDTIQSSVTYSLNNTTQFPGLADVENLTLTGTAAINGTGNAAANIITGNAAVNILTGVNGNDVLIGGQGNDIYVIDASTGYTITELTGTINGTADLVQSSASYTLAANVENLELTGTDNINGTGNGLANKITGNAGNNILDGGGEKDTLIGGLGDDTYVVDNSLDVVTESASAGTDSIQSSVSYTLSLNVENLTLTATGKTGIGNATNNTLTGSSGADTLNGAAGVDALIGGAGNDTYIIDSITGTTYDTITEVTGEGTDLVQSAFSYTLADNVENLTLTGAAAINGKGNAEANTIIGNAAVNILTGDSGNDVLIGGNGNDIYVIDATTYTITELASSTANVTPGIADLVQSSVSYTLATNVENLELTGTAANGTGNTLDNKITGNGENNTLSGLGGKDTLIGGLGDDTYIVDNSLDVVTEASSAGTDLIQSSASYTLSTNVENLTLTGDATTSLNATGNTLTNTITGDAGNNILNGGAGTDILLGLGGNDTYIVDTTTDSITDSAGTDTIESSVTYTLGTGSVTGIENLTLTGAAANGIGNELGNQITGNASANTLTGLDGADTLIGGLGNDILIGGNGADSLTGGVGSDNFRYENSGQAGDIITDFSVLDDTIQVVKSTFDNNLVLGPLNTTQFVLAESAGSTIHRFGYNSTTGNLWYDSDGSGAAAKVDLATLSIGLSLTNADIVVIA